MEASDDGSTRQYVWADNIGTQIYASHTSYFSRPLTTGEGKGERQIYLGPPGPNAVIC